MKTRVLLAENESQWVDIVKTLLPATKYDLETVSDYEKAQYHLETEEFDLAIINLNLGKHRKFPDRTGIQILEFIRDNNILLPRIVLTGDAGGPILETFGPLKVDDVLIKGHFSGTDLIKAIRSAIEKRANIPHDTPQNLGDLVGEASTDRIRQLVSKNNLAEAIQEMTRLSKFKDEALILSLRYHRIKERIQNGTITQDAADTELNKIAQTILELVP